MTFNQRELQAMVAIINQLRHFEAAPLLELLRAVQARNAQEAKAAGAQAVSEVDDTKAA